MPKSKPTELALQLPTHDHIDAKLWVSFREDPAQSIYPLHGHAWGEFIYAFHGVMEVKLQDRELITPPPYGIWLPPHFQHSGLNRTAVSHGTLYIHESLCTTLPQTAGILLSSPLVKSIFEHLAVHPEIQQTSEQQRLLHVLLDQLKHAPLVNSYLPSTEHPQLKKLLKFIYTHPSDQSPLSMLAQRINMTERTLARYAQHELGMSIHEWRQRFKVMQAMSMLNSHKTVENIALDLGYANASAFIHMFKGWMKQTPDQFRKQHSHNF